MDYLTCPALQFSGALPPPVDSATQSAAPASPSSLASWVSSSSGALDPFDHHSDIKELCRAGTAFGLIQKPSSESPDQLMCNFCHLLLPKLEEVLQDNIRIRETKCATLKQAHLWRRRCVKLQDEKRKLRQQLARRCQPQPPSYPPWGLLPSAQISKVLRKKRHGDCE